MKNSAYAANHHDHDCSHVNRHFSRRLSATGLPRLSTISNVTLSPSCRYSMPARCTAEMWTNKSLPPSSGPIKPKRLSMLNHFTVPVSMPPSSQKAEWLKLIQALGVAQLQTLPAD